MAETSIDVPMFYAALDQKRKTQGLTWRGLAGKLEISPSTFTRMAQGHRPDSDTFAALLAWIGMPVSAFLRGPEANSKEPDPMVMISSYLRASRNMRPEDAKALEDIIRTAYGALTKERA